MRNSCRVEHTVGCGHYFAVCNVAHNDSTVVLTLLTYFSKIITINNELSKSDGKKLFYFLPVSIPCLRELQLLLTLKCSQTTAS